MSDALHHNIDLILTGDKDFLEAGLRKPMIFTPGMMYEYMIQKQGMPASTFSVSNHELQQTDRREK